MGESEISINLASPVTRTSLKAKLYQIFSILSINEEKDVEKIICIAKRQPTATPIKLISKIKIQFKSELSFKKMVEFLDNQNLMIEYGFSGDFSTQISSSPSISSGSVVILENNNQLNEDETPLSSQLTTSSLYSSSLSMASLNSTLPSNNFVEFYSHQPIDDIDLLILFLENRRSSGGGETAEIPQLDESQHIITINYKHHESKRQTIGKQKHSFREFILNANEPFDKEKCPPDDRVLLVLLEEASSSSIGQDLLNLYLENLVDDGEEEENAIESIERSNFMKHVLIVRYKLAFNFNRVKRQNEKRPYLNNAPVRCYQAYETKTIVGKQSHQGRRLFDDGFIHSYLPKLAEPGTYSIKSTSSPSVSFIYFNNFNECQQTLFEAHQQPQAQVQFEYLYNVDLFEATSSHLFDEEERVFEIPTISTHTLLEPTINDYSMETNRTYVFDQVDTSTPLLISVSRELQTFYLHQVESRSLTLQVGWSFQNDWDKAKEFFVQLFQSLESFCQESARVVLESLSVMRLAINEHLQLNANNREQSMTRSLAECLEKMRVMCENYGTKPMKAFQVRMQQIAQRFLRRNALQQQ